MLSLQPEQLSRYRLRRSKYAEHLCTAEVAGLCLELAGAPRAAAVVEAYLEVFTERYIAAKRAWPLNPRSAAHEALAACIEPAAG